MTTQRPYRKTARAKSEAESRRRILRAAAACLAATPVGHVTLEEIAKRSGLSVQTVLRVHGSKDRLFVRAARTLAREAMRRRDDVATREPAAALDLVVDDYERWGEALERLAGQAEHVTGFAVLLGELRRHHRRWVRRLFARELAGLPAARRAEALAQLIVALDLGTYRRLRGEGLSRTAAKGVMRRLAGATFRRRS